MTLAFDTNPKLSRPTVYEIEFQMRFASSEILVQKVAVIREALKDYFPNIQRKSDLVLKIYSDPPETNDGEPAFYYKDIDIRDEDQNFRLINVENATHLGLGNRSLSFVYHNKDWDWEVFRERLMSCLIPIHGIGEINYKSISLIYKNKIPWNDGLNKKYISEWLLPKDNVPSNFSESIGAEISRAFSDPNGFVSVDLTFPAIDEEQSEYIHLEYSANIDISPDAYELGDVLKALEYAHDRIYLLFSASVTQEYMEDHK